MTALPEVWWEAGREEGVTAVSVLLDDDDSALVLQTAEKLL